MSRYYNQYQPLKPKRGYITFIVVFALIVAAAISLTVAFVIVPRINELREGQTDTGTIIDEPNEGNEDPTLTVLMSPYDLTVDISQTKLSWKCLDSAHAVGYCVKINGEEQTVYTNPVTVNLHEGMESQIYVKALGDNNEYADSPWSAVLTIFKLPAEDIAYSIVLSSLQNILEDNVTIPVGGVRTPITVNQIYTADYQNLKATVWYSYTANNSEGLACTTVIMPQTTGLLDYKNKQSQIESIINNNDIDTEYMTFITDDVTSDLLARDDLTGSLQLYRYPDASLTAVCSHTSLVNVSNGEATIVFRGIVRRERTNNVVNYYTYHYTARTAEIAGYTMQDYLDALADDGVAFTYTKTDAAEITGLGKEMLMMYEQELDGVE
ncbi:MAG: hypothetical protein PHI19_04790 [Clostridia bacterium]|nr:hypothetical protein [Clostridia bacterium]